MSCRLSCVTGTDDRHRHPVRSTWIGATGGGLGAPSMLRGSMFANPTAWTRLSPSVVGHDRFPTA